MEPLRDQLGTTNAPQVLPRRMLKHALLRQLPPVPGELTDARCPSSPMPPSLPQTVLEGWGRVRLNEERELIAARNRSREHADQLRRLALQASTPPGSINPHPSNPYYAGSQTRVNPATGRFNITLYNHFNLPVDVWWNPADPVRPPRRLHVNIAPNTYRIIHVGGRGYHFFVIPGKTPPRHPLGTRSESSIACSLMPSPITRLSSSTKPHALPPAPAQPASGYDSDFTSLCTLPPIAG